MVSPFQIPVTARDEFSDVLDALGKKIADAGKSTSILGKAFLDVGKARDGFAKTETAADRVGKAINQIGLSVFRTASDIKGLGPLLLGGGLGTLGSVTGLAALSQSWGRAGTAITNSAANIGIATANLTKMQSAANIAGSSGDAVTTSMQRLSATLNDAQWNGGMARGVLSQLGIAADGANDVRKTFLDLLDAISKQPSAAQQNKLASIFGIDPSLLTPDVRKGGAAAWTARENQADSRGANPSPSQTAAQSSLGQSWRNLEASGTGVWNQIIGDVGPVTKSVVDWFDREISGNRKNIAGAAEVGAAVSSPVAVATASSVIGSLLRGAGAAALGGTASGGIMTGLAAGGSAALYFLTRKSGDMIGRMSNSSGLLSLEGFGVPLPLPTDQAGQVIPIPPAGLSPGNTDASKLPLGLRYNNPLNLQPGGHEAYYASAHDGLEAAAETLLGYRRRYGIDTVAGIVGRWAPSSDPRNNTPAYIRDVTQQTGYAPNEELDLSSPKVLESLIAAMGRHEEGRSVGSPSEIADAVADALARKPMAIRLDVSMAGVPADTQIRATDAAGNPVPVRVEIRTPITPSP